LFVAANQEIDFRVSDTPLDPEGVERFRFADVDDLKDVPNSPENISIPLDEIEVERGGEHFFENPHLKVRWSEGGAEKKAEFVADINRSSGKIDLKNWAKVIDSLKTGKTKIEYPNVQLPSKDTLEGRILYILGDMQEKGTMDIEKETEDYFKVDLDPDDVEGACKKLVSMGLVDTVGDSSGYPFYRKRSPLGSVDDALSS
jgi:hypothetical protein